MPELKAYKEYEVIGMPMYPPLQSCVTQANIGPLKVHDEELEYWFGNKV